MMKFNIASLITQLVGAEKVAYRYIIVNILYYFIGQYSWTNLIFTTTLE